MRFHTIDYRERDGHGHRPGLLNRGYWLSGTPRLTPRCRLRGHRPVVDGHGPFEPGLHAVRWVACARCGVRPDPQGRLDPDEWDLGQPYTGPLERPAGIEWEHIKTAPNHAPGPWPAHPTGEISAQLVIGGSPGVSVRLAVGCDGDEHTLSGHVHLGRLGGLYWSLQRHGTWLQRRLIRRGDYYSREVAVRLDDARLSWNLWTRSDYWSSSDPRWRDGSLPVGPRDVLFGPRRYSYEDHGDPVDVAVRMPHGDDHHVRLQLQRRILARTRGRKRMSWSVDWRCDGGIPVRPNGRAVQSSAVDVSDVAVTEGTWPTEAAAAIAAQLTADRTRYGMRHAPA